MQSLGTTSRTGAASSQSASQTFIVSSLVSDPFRLPLPLHETVGDRTIASIQGGNVAYVITDNRISNKGASCTQRSPVECIHPTPEYEGIMNSVTEEVVAR